MVVRFTASASLNTDKVQPFRPRATRVSGLQDACRGLVYYQLSTPCNNSDPCRPNSVLVTSIRCAIAFPSKFVIKGGQRSNATGIAIFVSWNVHISAQCRPTHPFASFKGWDAAVSRRKESLH